MSQPPASEAEEHLLLNIGERIESAMTGLPRQQRRAAQFLRNHLADLVLYDSSEIAARCGVSNATMSRVVRALGFRDWRELKEHLRAAAHVGAPKARPLPEDAVREHLACEITNLESVFLKLDEARLDHAARLVHQARRVVVVGQRTSYPIALHLRGQLAQLREQVAVAPTPGHSMAEDLAMLGPEDVVVLIGLMRRLEGFGRLVRELKRRRVPFVLVADSTGRAHAASAEVAFEVPLDSIGGLGSYTAAMSLACVLENAVAGLDTSAAQRHHDEVSSWLDAVAEVEVS